MWQWIKHKYTYLHGTFHDSEVILWARAQYILLALYTALQSVDVSQVVTDRHLLQGYIFTNALVSELLRRRKADFNPDGSIK